MGIENIKDVWNGFGNSCEFPLITTKPVKDVIVDGVSVVNKANIAVMGTDNKTVCRVKKIGDRFFELKYKDLDYAYANEFFKTIRPTESVGYCSSVRNGNFYGRNFDWLYNDGAEFVIRIDAKNGRYASLNVASNIDGFDRKLVESGKYTEKYRVLPFFTVDGINECGVVVNVNVVPKGGAGRNVYTDPIIEKRHEMCSKAIPRFVLDNFSTAKEAVEYIRNYVSIFFPNIESFSHYESHFMIGDENETYILEAIDNRLEYLKVGEGEEYPSVMTNFHVNGTQLIDGKVDTSEENKSHVALLGAGLERYNIAVENLDSCDTLEGITELMTKKIKYTNTYLEETDPLWYSEMVGSLDLTLESPREDFGVVFDYARERFRNREENKEKGIYDTWQTTHTSVYDIANRELHLFMDEKDTEYVFKLEKYITLS